MDPQRILVLSEGQLGDLLLLTPSLRSLKESFPHATVHVCVVQRRSYASGAASSLLVTNPAEGTSEAIAPFTDEVIEVSRPALRQARGIARLRAEWTILRRIRAGRYDTAISCFPEDRFALWARFSGAKRRIGEEGQGLARLYTDRLPIRKEEGGVLRYYAALVSAAGATVGSLSTEFRVAEEDRVRACELLAAKGISPGEKFLVIHPGASGPFRVWPPERFARVAGILWKEQGVRTLLCGTAHDRHVLEAVRAHLDVDVPEVILEGSVRMLAGILSCSSLCLSNDSGPRHLAVAVGTPSVAIMPKHNDRAWGIYDRPGAAALMAMENCPLCPHDRCLDRHRAGEEFGSACIRMVSVEQVLREIERALRGNKNP
jgi:ADP-heptose:LPS heptosyltransferase